MDFVKSPMKCDFTSDWSFLLINFSNASLVFWFFSFKVMIKMKYSILWIDLSFKFRFSREIGICIILIDYLFVILFSFFCNYFILVSWFKIIIKMNFQPELQRKSTNAAKRSANFSIAEEDILTRLIKKYKNIITNKETNTISVKWVKITDKKSSTYAFIFWDLTECQNWEFDSYLGMK